jgi:serine/threonine protein kinase
MRRLKAACVGASTGSKAAAESVRGVRRCGRYEILHPLGVGGMAEVYKARVAGPAGFQREVVLKRLHACHGQDPEFVAMFEDEARILGLLHHPNVVQALDFAKSDGQLHLVLEYVEGPSLGRVLRSGRTVPPAIVAFIGREIARALDYVHNVEDPTGTPLRLVHRDVTPSNIMVTPSGTVKLLDFGIAKFATATQPTRGGNAKGKPGYLAPEQLRGDTEIDGRVDLFALGVVLYELLRGERLFSGENDLSTMKKIIEMKISPPSQGLMGVPPALDRIIMRALERDRSRRYANASQMARDLDAVVMAAELHVEDVAAFVRGVEATAPVALSALRVSPSAALEHEQPTRPASSSAEPRTSPTDDTRRDLLLPLRWWVNALSSGRRAALVAGLSLLLGAAGVAGWGGASLTTAGPRRSISGAHAAPAAPASTTPRRRAPASPQTIAQTVLTDR